MRNMYEHPAYQPQGIMKVIPFWEYRYPKTFIRVDTVLALFCVLAAIPVTVFAPYGYLWGAALVAAAAVRLWIAYQLVLFVRS
jgi:hypothetical protein